MADKQTQRGRPTKYSPELCQKVIELGKLGKSHNQIASALGVYKATLNDWADAYPEFSISLKIAKQEAQTWFEDIGQQGLFADKFQASLWAKQVSCRFHEDYREKQEVKLDGTLEVINAARETLMSKIAHIATRTGAPSISGEPDGR